MPETFNRLLMVWLLDSYEKKPKAEQSSEETPIKWGVWF